MDFCEKLDPALEPILLQQVASYVYGYRPSMHTYVCINYKVVVQ